MQVYQQLSKLIVLLIIIMATVLVSPTLAQQADRDGDGVPDTRDRCPDDPGPASNDGCPFILVIPTSVPPDSDGDGLNDNDDACPNQAGSVDNRGCPPSSVPPNNPPPSNPNPGNPQPSDNDGDGIPNDSDQCPDSAGAANDNGCPPPALPPFQPPLLSNDSCFVTASGDYNARVRNTPSLAADQIGNLLPGVIYPAAGTVENAEGQWIKLAGDFQHLDYEATVGLAGYVFGEVVNSSNCPPVDDGEVAVFVPPIDGFACTITTPFNWEFAFNAAVGEAIPVGTSAQAILSGDLENFGDASMWVAELRTLGDMDVEYMTYGELGDPEYRSFPRTGGTCGLIGDSVRTGRLVSIPLPSNGDGDTDGRDFLVWQRNNGATEDDGELDLYLVNAPGGDLPPPEFPWQVSFEMVLGGEGTGADTVEICYYAELYEEGVYNEICVEIEIPEGCILRQPEAGVYIIECEEDTVQLNPLFGDDPIIDLQGTQQNTPYYKVKLQNVLISSYSIPANAGGEGLPAPEEPQTIEYCVYEEVSEAGVFQEVCYEIEIPEGCVLTTAEAGVYTMDCDGENVQVNPLFDDATDDFQTEPRPQYDVFNELCEGNYLIWWDTDENGQLIVGTEQGACLVWR